MLLRSSSTPILGSLLHSSSSPLHFSESATTHHHHHHHHLHNHPSFHSFHCNISPLSDSSDHHNPSSSSIRRAQSDGNLHSLLSNHLEDSYSRHHRRSNPVLEPIPSFSMHHSKRLEDDDEEEEEEEEEYTDAVGRTVAVGESISRELSFSHAKHDARMDRNAGGIGGSAVSPLFLARGLGIDRVASGLFGAGSDAGGCGGGGGDGNCSVLTGDGGERSDTEMYYRKMVEENPSNALFLRNYAQFLYETKGDPKRAEEYYSRAVLAEPGDGEILSQYAKLVWEQHHDEERASSYFEQAVQAAPNDSHVLAAYAGFLWETEEDDGGGDREKGPLQDYTGSPVPHETLASASA